MTRLEEKNHTYFTTVRGMCRNCRQITPARIYFQNANVYQQSLCPTCDNPPALICGDKDWYMEHVLRPRPDNSPLHAAKPSQKGCPLDCGPCAWHATPCQLPVISITNACNLRCPICFTHNRPDKIFHKPVEEMQQTVDWLIESSGPVDLINITGGEPTLHPRIIDILKTCDRPDIGRITMNSNGITLADNYTLCEQLAELNVCAILSFNTFDSEVSKQMNAADLVETKLKAIENLKRAGTRMTLLNVLTHNLNENAIGPMLRLMHTNDHILSLTIQTMTYSGQGGSSFPKIQHIPVDNAARIVSVSSNDSIKFDDFISRPSCHPLCYLICYLIKDGDELIPLTRFAPAEKIADLITDSYLIHPGRGEEFFKDIINDLYAQDRTEHLAIFRKLFDKLFPTGQKLTDFQRQRIAESAIRTVYIHSHMDEDTFDCSRAMTCPDLMPTEPGRLVPACTYNLFYRTQDKRFYAPTEKTNA